MIVGEDCIEKFFPDDFLFFNDAKLLAGLGDLYELFDPYLYKLF